MPRPRLLSGRRLQLDHIELLSIHGINNAETATGQKMRYNLLGQGGHWFPGVNAAEFDEKAVSESLGTHPCADRIPAILREAHASLYVAPVHQRLSQSD